MMQAMRKSSKIIFLIVLVSFAGFMVLGYGLSIFGRGNQGKQRGVEEGVIGKVNGVAVSSYAFDDAYRKKMETLSKDDHEPTDQEMEQAKNDIWNSMTTLSVIEQEASKHGIVISDADVANYMRNGPPKDIREAKDFQTNGQFDISKYQGWLQQMAISQDPRAQTFINDMENQIKQQLLVARVQDFVLSMVRITPEDAKADFIEKNDKVTVRYFFIPGGDFDSSVTTVPDADVSARYEKDKEQYKQPEMAVLTYVQFPVQPSEKDLAQAKGIIDSLYQQVLAGANFDTLAKDRSQDPGSAAKGGDLGWFTEDKMVKPFAEATKKIQKIGEIAPPIQTQYGWHIIKLTGKRTAKDKDKEGKDQMEYQASHILIKTDPSTATINETQQKATDFKTDAEKHGLKQSAADFTLTTVDTKPFPKGTYVSDIGVNQALNDFAFTAKIGDLYDVVQGRNTFYVCQLTKKTPAGYTAFADAKDRIQKTILREKRVEMAHQKCQVLADEIAKGKSFDQVAQEAGKPIQETDFFNRTMFVPKIGNDPDFTGAAFVLSPSHPTSGAVNSRTGGYILQYIDRQAPDTAAFAAMSDSLTQTMAAAKRKDIWSKWLNETKQKADIQDFRATYYGSGS